METAEFLSRLSRMKFRFRFLPLSIDLKPYLEKFKKPAKENGDVRDIRYRLVSNYGTRFVTAFRFRKSSIYRDAEFNFILSSGPWFYLTARAIISFNIFVDPGDGLLTMRVRQIQAIRNRARTDPVPGIRWEKMLLEIVIDYAKKNGFECVEVSSAKANRWRWQVPLERLILRYDVVAKRRGFKPDAMGEAYRLRIA